MNNGSIKQTYFGHFWIDCGHLLAQFLDFRDGASFLLLETLPKPTTSQYLTIFLILLLRNNVAVYYKLLPRSSYGTYYSYNYTSVKRLTDHQIVCVLRWVHKLRGFNVQISVCPTTVGDPRIIDTKEFLKLYTLVDLNFPNVMNTDKW